MATGQSKLARPRPREQPAPGATNEGGFYRINIHPQQDFRNFRNADRGKGGHITALRGQRQDGTWDTQAYLVGMDDVHTEGTRLVADTTAGREILDLVGPVRHVRGNIYRGTARAPTYLKPGWTRGELTRETRKST